MARNTQPRRTVRHTVCGGHSAYRAQRLMSDRVQNVISEVAEKLKVTRPHEVIATATLAGAARCAAEEPRRAAK